MVLYYTLNNVNENDCVFLLIFTNAVLALAARHVAKCEDICHVAKDL